MASNHAASSGTFNDPISMIDGSDSVSATQVRQILEKLHDNTANLQSRLPAAASQAEQEVASDTAKFVTPGFQQYHPSAAKFWARVSVSGGTPALLETYNVTSITDNGVGDLTVTIATDFASGSWCGLVSTRAAAPRVTYVAAQAAGSCQVKCSDLSGVATDPDGWNVVGYGDQ